MILALDTATATCSVALRDGAATRAHLVLRRPRAHAEWLMPLVQDALRYAGATLADIEAVAVTNGPGSYTGLRIGLSTAKGLCAATGAAILGIPTLSALAEAGRGGARPGEAVVATLPARKGEVYAAAFRVPASASDALEPLGEAAALRLHDVAAGPHDAHRALLPLAADWLAERLPNASPDTAPNTAPVWIVGAAAEALHPFYSSVRSQPHAEPLADAIAACAARRLARGEADDLAALSPDYLKVFAARRSVNPLHRLRAV